MNKKKLMNYLMIVSAVFLLAACGNPEEGTKTKTEDALKVEDNDQKESETKVTKEPEITNLTIEKNNGQELEVDVSAKGEDISYAFYITTNDGEVLKKFMYQKEPSISYTVPEPGQYKVRVFVKDKEGNKISKYTEVVEFPY